MSTVVDKIADSRHSLTMPNIAESSPTDDPAAAIAAVIALRRLADRLEREAVDRAIEQGWTWAQVAQALGITRQAAHKRHAARLRGRMTEEQR